MSGGVLALVVASFLAAAVEVVEALTIVLALGVTRDWRSTLTGVGAALLVLVALVAALGPALASIPIDVLRLVVGSLLLIFGLQWLRKAILRAAGYRPTRDEAAVYEHTVQQARTPQSPTGRQFDWYAFTVSFKSVVLEGLEVVFIVLAFGAISGSLTPALVGTSVAILTVVVAGIALRAPLSRVPENQLKFVVGALLTTLGLFWSVEGLGIAWPIADEGAIPLILLYVLVDSFSLTWLLRALPSIGAWARATLTSWSEFLIGDDWALAAGVVVVFAFVRVASRSEGVLQDWAWTIAPIGVVLVLSLSLVRAARSSKQSA